MTGSRVRRGPASSPLHRWLDEQLRTMAVEAGAVERVFPPSIAAETLTRAGFFDAFPGGATRAPAPEDGAYLPPAVCYHAYAELRGLRIDPPALLTAVQTCYRDADRDSNDEARLWEFTMREVIFIGPASWIAAQRRGWTARAQAFAARLHLAAVVEPATDPFFGDLSRGRRLIQQLKGLKDELRLTLGARSIAAASFNTHGTFFGARFDLRLQDGSLAHSGCAAFGIDRWALALQARHGAQAAGILED